MIEIKHCKSHIRIGIRMYNSLRALKPDVTLTVEMDIKP